MYKNLLLSLMASLTLTTNAFFKKKQRKSNKSSYLKATAATSCVVAAGAIAYLLSKYSNKGAKDFEQPTTPFTTNAATISRSNSETSILVEVGSFTAESDTNSTDTNLLSEVLTSCNTEAILEDEVISRTNSSSDVNTTDNVDSLSSSSFAEPSSPASVSAELAKPSIKEKIIGKARSGCKKIFDFIGKLDPISDL